MNHIRQIRPRILQHYTSAIVAIPSLMIIALLSDTNTSASAQVHQSSNPIANASESQTESGAMTSTLTSDEHIPGTLYLDGPGEILFEELPDSSQDAIVAIGKRIRSQNSTHVHGSYSIHTRAMAIYAKTQKATYQAGIKGLFNLGPTP